MKRLFASFFARTGMVVGFLLSSGAVQAAISDYAGSYAANLSSMETPAGGGEAVEVFYGRLEVKVTATGSATGSLRTRAGKSYPFKTTLTEGEGSAVQRNVGVAPLKGTTGVFLVNFRLTVNSDGTVVVAGENFNPNDANAIFFTTGSLKFLTFTGKQGNTPAWAGNYTLALLAPEGAPETVPAGAGFATLTVNSVGKLLYSGKLGDGTKFTGSAAPSTGAVYSIYAVPPGYLAGGYVLGEFDLDKRGEQTSPTLWNKLAKASDKAYPAGFSTSLIALVEPWFVPAKKAYPIAAELGFGSSKNFAVDFSGEGLLESDFSTSLPDTSRITGLANIQAVAGAAGTPAENDSKAWNKLWNVKLNPFTGAFAGKQTLKRTAGGKTTTTMVDVEGVMSLADALSSEPFAYGQYRVKTATNTTTGLVTFSGPLVNNTVAAAAGAYTSVADLAIPDAYDSMTDPAMTGKPASTKIPGLPTSLPKLTYGLMPAPNQNERKVTCTVKFTVAEDLRSVVFNGVKLSLEGSVTPLGMGVTVYTNARTSPRNSITLHVVRNSTTGVVNGYIATFTQISLPMPKMAVITAASAAGSSSASGYTSVTKL